MKGQPINDSEGIMGRKTEVRGDPYSMEALLRLARTQKNNRASRRMLGIAHVLGGMTISAAARAGHGAAGAGRRHQALQRGRAGGPLRPQQAGPRAEATWGAREGVGRVFDRRTRSR